MESWAGGAPATAGAAATADDVVRQRPTPQTIDVQLCCPTVHAAGRHQAHRHALDSSGRVPLRAAAECLASSPSFHLVIVSIHCCFYNV